MNHQYIFVICLAASLECDYEASTLTLDAVMRLRTLQCLIQATVSKLKANGQWYASEEQEEEEFQASVSQQD